MCTFRSQLNSLQPVQITELEAEFQKVQDEAQKAQPTRYLRSQQKKQAKIVAEAAEAEEGKKISFAILHI